MIISPTGQREWTNRHQTFTQTIDNLYDLGNRNTGDVLADYNDTSKGIQGIIKEAIDKGKTLRVLGGGWSWTRIAACEGILLNTKALNISFKIGKANLAAACTLQPEELYFAQCGVSVKELNDRLKARGRSLKTSGASNGQTIAGAMSTGTHGSAIDIGSIPDYVTGLHILVSPMRSVWLERSSRPVVSDSFTAAINAELLRDDSLFNAALVSFGSFGFIHGVMVETSPLFLYESHRLRISMDDRLFRLMETLDFSGAPLPHGSERPYHFQVLINQYDQSNMAYTTVMYKRPYHTGYTPPVTVPGTGPGDDAPVFIGKLTQAAPALVPGLVNRLIEASYKPYQNQFGTHGEIFFNTDTHGKVLSAAIGVPLDKVNKVTKLLISLNNTEGPFVGVLAFRYVKGTKATLGFTCFDPTCIIELDGVLSRESYDFYAKVWKMLEENDIPFTFHWGKILELNPERLRKIYGEKVEEWIIARNSLMKDAASMRVFTNKLLTDWGLSRIGADTNPVSPAV